MSKIIDGINVYTKNEAKALKGLVKGIMKSDGSPNCTVHYIAKEDRIPFGYTDKCFVMYKMRDDNGLYSKYRIPGTREKIPALLAEGYIMKKPADHLMNKKEFTWNKPSKHSVKKISLNDNLLDVFTEDNDAIDCECVGYHKNFVFMKSSSGDEYVVPLKKSVFNKFLKNKTEKKIVVSNPLMKNIYEEYKRDNNLQKFCESVEKNASGIAALSHEDFNKLFEVDKSTIDVSRLPNLKADIRAALNPSSPTKVYRCPVTRKFMLANVMYSYRTCGLVSTCRQYLM